MGDTIWTAVFTLSSTRDSAEEVAESINGLVGAELQRRLAPSLRLRGWDFGTPHPESHGWHSEARVLDEGKTLVAHLVTCPELDEPAPDGGALQGRWRVVVGLDLGLFSGTKARRGAMFKRLAGDLEAGCRELGASDVLWEVGGP